MEADPEAPATAPDGPASARLLLRPWSVVRTVLALAGGLALVAFLAAASRPLGWVAVAVTVAALLEPPVAALSRWVPRAVAVVAVLLSILGLVALLVFGAVGDVGNQLTRLERAAPRAARDIERSERFGELAAEVELGRRVDEFVEGLPERLRGGDEVAALRAAATRGIAYLATIVLTLFLMVSGPRLLDAGLRQLPDPARRARVRTLLVGAHRLWWRYLVFTLGRMVAAGLFAYVVARVFDVPGPVLLALWVGAWAVVPTIGVAVGAAAIALLAVPDSFQAAGSVLAFFAGYQVLEDALIQPRLEHRSLHVGAFVTFVAAVLGLEVYGIGGLIGGVVAVVFAAAVVKELGVAEDEGLWSAAQDVLDDNGAAGPADADETATTEVPTA